MSLSFEGAVRAGFALALAILVLISGLSYESTRRLIETEDAVYRSQEVTHQLDDLLIEVLEEESAARGYLIGGQDFYLEPYFSAIKKLERTVGELRAWANESPRQQRALDELNAPLREKLAYHRQLIELRRAQRGDAGLQLFFTGRGHVLMDEIRDAVGRMDEEETRVLREKTLLARKRAHWSVLLVVVGSLLSFGILLSVHYHLSREIARRRTSERNVLKLNRLYAALSRVGQAIVHIRDRDELFLAVCRIAVADDLFRMAWIGVVDPATGAVRPAASAGFEDGYLGRIRITTRNEPEGQGPTGLALRERRRLVCADIAADPRVLPWRDEALARGYRSSAAFPILRGDSVAGVFTVYAAEPGFFDQQIVDLLGKVVADVSFALEGMERESRRLQAEADLHAREQQILQLNESLERRVEERTAELARVAEELELRKQEAERANRMKTEFLARMSHELRTPLNAILGYSDLLNEEPEGPLPPRYKRFARNIQEGARHLLQIVNDVLDLSRIEAGRIDLQREVFDCSAALEEVLSVITPLANIKRMRIDNELPAGAWIDADRIRFKQIFYNLLSNAVKFTPEGGRVWIELIRHDGEDWFSVHDTGRGIPRAEKEAIFDEFHQVAAPPGSIKEGAGLGLAITRRLAELHGGSIRVESVEGKGSCFLFSLGPRIEAAGAGA
ncbi:MAG: CHASE3 domain-containing protein [Acidobacteriia bacterium]|nr:CHASE3 domain-containing protein [Terriglobia bacterium]